MKRVYHKISKRENVYMTTLRTLLGLETAELSPEKRRDIYIEPKLVIREKYNKKIKF